MMGEKIPEEWYRTCFKSALDGREGRIGFPKNRNVMQAFCLHHTRKDCLSYASSIQYVILHFTQKTTFLQCGCRFGRIFLYHNALFPEKILPRLKSPAKSDSVFFSSAPSKMRKVLPCLSKSIVGKPPRKAMTVPGTLTKDLLS